MAFKFKKTKLSSVILITPDRFEDERGYFEETWNYSFFEDIELALPFVQDNHSYSIESGTLRGLHFQAPPYAQDKLVRCTRGAIYDVAVDIRKDSSSYGEWVGEELSKKNGNQLLIPKGFLHGFITLTAETEVQYKCTNYYSPEHDGAVLWSSLNIDWPIIKESVPKISKKDKSAIPFDLFESPFSLGDKL